MRPLGPILDATVIGDTLYATDGWQVRPVPLDELTTKDIDDLLQKLWDAGGAPGGKVMKYYEVVSQDGHTTRTQLVYGDTPGGAIQTARAYGLTGKIVEVRELMLCSVWLPLESVKPPEVR